jgi:hypothetical protein
MWSSVAVSTLENSRRGSGRRRLISPRVNVERCFCPPDNVTPRRRPGCQRVGERDRALQIGIARRDQISASALRLVVAQVVPQQIGGTKRILRYQ